MTVGTPESGTARVGLLIVGSAAIWFIIYRCLKDGVVVSRGWRVERAARPVLYWLLIALFALLSVVLVWAAISTALAYL
jgi:hypothetical protein